MKLIASSILLASWTPTIQDLYLLFGDPQRAVMALGAILAAILLFWGVLYFFLKYILPYLRG